MKLSNYILVLFLSIIAVSCSNDNEITPVPLEAISEMEFELEGEKYTFDEFAVLLIDSPEISPEMQFLTISGHNSEGKNVLHIDVRDSMGIAAKSYPASIENTSITKASSAFQLMKFFEDETFATYSYINGSLDILTLDKTDSLIQGNFHVSLQKVITNGTDTLSTSIVELTDGTFNVVPYLYFPE